VMARLNCSARRQLGEITSEVQHLKKAKQQAVENEDYEDAAVLKRRVHVLEAFFNQYEHAFAELVGLYTCAPSNFAESRATQIKSSNCASFGGTYETPEKGIESKPTGPDSYFELVHDEVFAHAAPVTSADVVGVISRNHGVLLFGTPYSIAGNPWLRLDERTREELGIDCDNVWVLINGESRGLGELVKPVQNANSGGSTVDEKASHCMGVRCEGNSGSTSTSRVSSQPAGPDAHYEIVADKVDVLDAPLMSASSVGIVSREDHGSHLYGTPYQIDGMLWLRLDDNTCEELNIYAENAWAAIEALSFSGVQLRLVVNEPINSCGKPDPEDDGVFNSSVLNEAQSGDDGNEEDLDDSKMQALGSGDCQQHLLTQEIKRITTKIAVAVKAKDAKEMLHLLNSRSGLYRKDGAFDKALADLELCVKLAPDDPRVRYKRAITKLEVGGHDAEALGDIRAAQRMGLNVDASALEPWVRRAKCWMYQPERKNHYRTLGVQIDGSDVELKLAYRRALLRCHPDKEGGSTESFRAVQEAWQVLSDKEQRNVYDFGGYDAAQTDMRPKRWSGPSRGCRPKPGSCKTKRQQPGGGHSES